MHKLPKQPDYLSGLGRDSKDEKDLYSNFLDYENTGRNQIANRPDGRLGTGFKTTALQGTAPKSGVQTHSWPCVRLSKVTTMSTFIGIS